MAAMLGGLRIGRKRRKGLTTVEYALMLFFFAVTCIFGFPSLAKSTMRTVTNTGDCIDRCAATR
jgi:Flp pilus assembly pilin Flp